MDEGIILIFILIGIFLSCMSLFVFYFIIKAAVRNGVEEAYSYIKSKNEKEKIVSDYKEKYNK
jgi:hypothetical protein